MSGEEDEEVANTGAPEEATDTPEGGEEGSSKALKAAIHGGGGILLALPAMLLFILKGDELDSDLRAEVVEALNYQLLATTAFAVVAVLLGLLAPVVYLANLGFSGYAAWQAFQKGGFAYPIPVKLVK